MQAGDPVRVLVITDHTDNDPDLNETVRRRAELGPTRFRVLVTNPARAEYHLLHPERHDDVERAKHALVQLLDSLSVLTGGAVEGDVSIRHDAFEAVEEDLLERPANEILVAVHEPDFRRRLHHDLPRRLQHLHVPVTTVQAGAVAR